ncbi:MAG: MFS transporter [Clostridium sp.]|nr:MFS transporter [Clostridium sp.]
MELEKSVDKLDIADKITKKEAGKAFSIFHASSVNGTAMLMAAIISSYFSVYMTDTLMIPAASCSMIMLIAFLWDAVNDPMMGVLADRTNTKVGRYRPYFLAAPILLTIFGTLIWVNPGFSVTGKIIWVIVTYIGYGMTVTMYTMPQMAILPAHVKDTGERNKVIALGAGCCAAMFTIGSTFTPQIKGFFEGTFGVTNGYIPMMIILGLMSCISFWGLYATSEERYIIKTEKKPIMQDLKILFRHKELAPFLIVWVMASMGYGLMFATSVYYMMYYIGRPDLISVYMGIVSIGALISMVVLMPIVLRTCKTGQKSLLVSVGGSSICYIILFFFGKSNIMILYVLTFIATCLSSMQNALVNVLVNDAIDYVRYKDGLDANGIISSVKGFAQKCGNTVTNSGILAVLAVSGYIAGAVGQQPESAMFAINFLRFGAPVVSGVILLTCLKFNPVAKHYDDIAKMKENM